MPQTKAELEGEETDGSLHLISDIFPHEVSFVGKGANRRKFFLTKMEGGEEIMSDQDKAADDSGKDEDTKAKAEESQVHVLKDAVRRFLGIEAKKDKEDESSETPFEVVTLKKSLGELTEKFTALEVLVKTLVEKSESQDAGKGDDDKDEDKSAELVGKFEVLEKSLSEASEAIKGLSSQKEELEKKISSLEAGSSEVKEQAEELKKQISELRGTADPTRSAGGEDTSSGGSKEDIWAGAIPEAVVPG